MAQPSIDTPVWGYRVELDGQPIYFGIGQEGRWKHVTSGRSHNRVLRGLARDKARRLSVIPTDWPFASRGDAQHWERDMIAFFGRWDLGRGRLVNHTDGGDGGSGEDMRRERARRRAAGWTMPEHQRKAVASRNREAMRALAQTDRFWMKDPAKKQAAAQKIAARRKANGTCRCSAGPWRNINASLASLRFWAFADEVLRLKSQGATRRQISDQLSLTCSHSPWDKLTARAKQGWTPAQDIDWDEWTRAFRAKPLTGEHSNGTNPTRSKELQPVH